MLLRVAPFHGMSPKPDVYTESNLPDPSELGYLPNTKAEQSGGASTANIKR